MKKLNKKKFIEEYDKLCRKYKVMIVSEDYYCGVELNKIKENDHEVLLNQLSERDVS